MEKDRIDMVLMGGSAGALDAILRILSQIRKIPAVPIAVVLHRKTAYETLLVHLLKDQSPVTVKEAEEKETAAAGHMYVAPADYHLLFEADGSFSLDASEKVNFSRPSIDVSFASAATVYGSRLACILLSGANGDGTEGLRAARAGNAVCMVQSPASAIIPFMPEHAIKELGLHEVYSPEQIGAFINQL